MYVYMYVYIYDISEGSLVKARTPKANLMLHRKLDVELHVKGNSNSHGARPVY